MPGRRRAAPLVNSLMVAEGIRFTCPKCQDHRIICWQPSVPEQFPPGPGRWRMHGSGYHDLTFHGYYAGDSVHLRSGCRAHFFVRNGHIDMV